MLTYVGTNVGTNIVDDDKKRNLQWRNRIPCLSRPCKGKFDTAFLALPKSLGLVDKTNAVQREREFCYAVPLPANLNQ